MKTLGASAISSVLGLTVVFLLLGTEREDSGGAVRRPRVAFAQSPSSGDEKVSLPRIGPFVSGMDPLWYPWTDAGEMSKDFSYTTVFRRSLFPKKSTYGTRTGKGGAVGITVLGKSTREVLVQCLRLPAPSYLVNETKFELDSRWDIVFSRSSGWTLEGAWQKIAEILCEIEEMTLERFRGPHEILIPNAEGTRILREEEIDWSDPGSGSFRALPKLLTQFGKKQGMGIDSAPWQSRLYLDTRGVELWSLSAEEFRRWLGEWGVRFTRDRREVELIRVIAKR